METQLNNLIESWKLCFSTVNSSSNDLIKRQEAIQFIENFKQTSPFILDIGLYLAIQQQESCEMAHFGIQLIVHAIKYKWNDLNDLIKHQIKSKMIHLIASVDSRSNTLYSNGPNYLKNGISTIIIELLKREWPQNWPTFLDELFNISSYNNNSLSFDSKKISYIILKYIAEELISDLDSNIPTLRRKDFVHFLTSNMEKITQFYLNNLEFCLNLIQSGQQRDQQEKDSIIDLAKSCLESLNYFMGWLSISNLFSRDFLLIKIMLTLIDHEILCVQSTQCLISLIERKNSSSNASDRKSLLLVLFDSNFLNPILNGIKKSIENNKFKKSLKFLVKILVGLGFQLSTIWSQMTSNDNRPQKAQLESYLNSILELVMCPNKFFSNEAIQLCNTLLSNELIKRDEHELIINFLVQIAKIFTNSTVLFRISNSELVSQDSDDLDEDYSRFFQKYRNDLAKSITLGANIYLEPFFINSYEWSMKLIQETNDLNSKEDDQSGFDPNSFLYMCWDSVVFLWNNLIQVINKKAKLQQQQQHNQNANFNQLKSNLMSLIESCIKLKSKNPNYTSFNLSLLSSILQSCELFEEQERENLFKIIFDKLFNEFQFFKNESVQLLTSSQITVNLKHYMNVRRQLAANVLNICRNYTKYLNKMLTPIYQQVNAHIECIHSTQMEKIILIQSLIYLSNHLSDFQSRLSFISNILTPTYTFFNSQDFQTHLTGDSISFANYIGLNKIGDDSDIHKINRKQIFYHVNLLFGILKSLDLNVNSSQMQQQCLNDRITNGTMISATSDDLLKNNFFSYLFKLFSNLLDLFKSFSNLHSLTSKEIHIFYLNLPESAKAGIVGTTHQQAHGVNVLNSENIYNEDQPSLSSSADKCLMFFYNTYETLSQLIGLFLTKFREELLLTETDQDKLTFIYKLGESIFSNLNQLPNFRVRLIIRYILRSCLMSDSFDKQMIERQFVIIKMNEVFLEFFLPNILSRITETNKYYANMIDKEEPPSNRRDLAQISENTRNQIIEENIFSVMCRDLVDLIKLIFNFNTSSSTSVSSSSHSSKHDIDHETIDTENNSDNMNSSDSMRPKEKTSNLTACNVSELAVHLLNNKVIYQSMILCLFEGLNWPDSYCCSRLVRINLSLMEHSTSSELTTTPNKPIRLILNEQSVEQLFLCCLFALQTHGEDAEIANLLINLAYLIHQRYEPSFSQIFHKILIQIPNMNAKMYDEFVNLCKQTHNSKEKLRKDLFKKLLQPIVGKASNQFQKSEISIRILPTYNITSEKKKAKFDLERVNDTLDYNICSLFDSVN